MARIQALDPPFTPDVAAQLSAMMPPGAPPIGLFRTFAKNLPMTVAMSQWGRYERALIQVADALHDSSDINDELWQAARGVLDEPQLLDLFLLCGSYHAISFAARAARLELEPGAPRFADATP